jgi:hypothetical protein
MTKRIDGIARHHRDRRNRGSSLDASQNCRFGVEPVFDYRAVLITAIPAITSDSGRLFRLPWPPLKIYSDVTLGLALQTRITQRRRPSLRGAIVFKPAVLHGFVLTLAHVMQNNPGTFIFCHRKTEPIGATGGRHPGAPLGVAKIAELAQLGF